MRTRSAIMDPYAPKLYIGLTVPRCRDGRIGNHHPFRIPSDDFTEIKNSRGISCGAHAANGDASHDPAQDVKLRGPHVAVEEIVHVRIGDERSDGVAPDDLFE